MTEPPRSVNPDETISPILLDRARRALDRDYQIGSVVGAGGMGFVLEALHRRLARKVAIKVLRPEHATAAGATRFLAEARLLARLDHPNVVTVYDAGEVDGLLYYVMEYIAGQTLADRLRSGPLAPEEFGRFADDLLAGIHAVHRLGVIHRDIKPANIFLHEGRALLADFGIARETESGETSLTTPGHLIGTPRYMAPEQRDGKEVTSQTDLYAAGLVLWEAGTGTGWPETQTPEHADWSTFSLTRASALRRALARVPARRWPDAAGFRQALQRRTFSRAGLLTGVGLVALALGAFWYFRSTRAEPEDRGAPLPIAVLPFDVSPAPGNPGLGDSIAAAMVTSLHGYPDFGPSFTRGAGSPGAIELRGSALISGDSIRLSLPPGAADPQLVTEVRGLRTDWRSVADSLSVAFAQSLWYQQPDAAGLAAALPKSRSGFASWFQGEQLWARAEWEAAAQRYQLAERQDSTCLLCSYRLLDIDRWLAQPRDDRRLARLVRLVDSFPRHYRALILAANTSMPARGALLRRAADSFPDFFLTSFEYGDELLHRGPLFGGLRGDALDPLVRAMKLRPTFGPVLEHHAWLLIWMGDSAGARADLAALRTPQQSGFTAALRLFLKLGYEWRFSPLERARALTRSILENPQVGNDPDSWSGARLMMTLNAPRGAVELGAMLASQRANREAVREGLLGELFGYAALGRLDSLRVVATRFAELGDRSLSLTALELDAILRSFDPDSTLRARSSLDLLEPYLRPRLYPADLRRRAAWAMGIVAARSGDAPRLNAARQVLSDEPAPRLMSRTVDAQALAMGGNWKGAFATFPSLPALDALPDSTDVMMDTVAHLLRAEWLEARGEVDSARLVLRWHEHMEVLGHGGGPPHPGEPAWAMNGLASWLRARLLERLVREDPMGSGRSEQCDAYRRVAELWAGAPAPFGERADSARRVSSTPACRKTA